MDEDLYAANVDTSKRSMESLLEEYKVVREGIKIMLENSTTKENSFMGNGVNHKLTARALGHIMIGHSMHHTNVIKERYLS
jgi:hypothetical protein